MRAGELRHRVTIQKRTGSEWVDFSPAWAAREMLTGQENFERSDQLLQDKNLVRFRIRYRADFADETVHKFRVIWSGRAFDVQKVEEPDNINWQMGLLCLEVPYDG